MANLAARCRDQGRRKEAESLEAQVMEARKRELEEEYPDTLTTMSDLMLTYRDQGRLKEGRITRSASNGGEKEGTGRGASGHADQLGVSR